MKYYIKLNLLHHSIANTLMRKLFLKCVMIIIIKVFFSKYSEFFLKESNLHTV